MQTIQTKKLLDPEERKLIQDLSKRGFLPKGIANEPLVVESILEEQLGGTTPVGIKKNISDA